MSVITVSGGLASGARDVARLVAVRLNYDYVDQQLLVEAARTLGVSYESLESRDERLSTVGERVASMLRSFLERSAAAGVSDPMLGGPGLELLLARTYGEAASLPESAPHGLDDKRYISTLTSIVRDIAGRGDVVILGRGSQAILQGWPGSLHVLVTASTEYRIASLVERDQMAREDAERRIQESDRARSAFHRKFFKVDVENPCLYDLVVRVSRVPVEAAAELIIGAARAA